VKQSVRGQTSAGTWVPLYAGPSHRHFGTTISATSEANLFPLSLTEFDHTSSASLKEHNGLAHNIHYHIDLLSSGSVNSREVSKYKPVTHKQVPPLPTG
jgi:hypothetical protein